MRRHPWLATAIALLGLSGSALAAPTATGLSLPSISTYGQSIAITATVTPSTATGTVTFYDGGVQIASPVTLTSGSATLNYAGLTAGGHTITATYNGDSSNGASTSAGLAETVNPGSSTITVTGAPNPVSYPSFATFTAQTGPAVNGTYPTGAVTLYIDGNPSSSGDIDVSTGQATITAYELSPGSHSIYAFFPGDSNYSQSTSSTITESVLLQTQTFLSSTKNPSAQGASVTFEAYVSAEAPSGTVTFNDNGSSLGTVTLDSNSHAQITVQLSVLGTHPITAVYNGDGTNGSSTSEALNQLVLTASSISNLSVSPISPKFGQPTNLTATLNPSAASGKVTFFDGATPIGTATISSGQATLTSPLLGFGRRFIRAVYEGDSTYAPSTNTQTVTVASAPQVGVASPTDTTIGPNTYAIAVGDFNQDGKQDVAVTTSNSDLGYVYVLLGNGNGTFQTPVVTPGAVGVTALAVADMDGDGHQDLVFADGQNGVGVMLGTGTGSFGTPNNDQIGLVNSISVGDYNNDGIPDVIAGFGDGTVLVLAGIGDGTLDYGQYVYSLSGGGAVVGAVDLDGDGNTDIVTADSSGAVDVFLGNGSFSFPSPIVYGTTIQPSSIAISDLNADGRPDVIIGNNGTGVSVLLNSAGGVLQTPVSYTAGAGIPFVATGDFNGDGKTDIAVTDTVSNNVYILNGVGDGTFQAAQSAPAGAPQNAIAVGEFSGTLGLADIAVGFGSVGDMAVLPAVNAQSPTTLSLGSSANPSQLGQSITLTANLSSSTATGTITFYDGSTPIGTGSLSAGSATLQIATLSLGTHLLKASYPGDFNDAASSSSVLSQVVNQDTTTTSLGSSGNPSTFGGSVTFTATVTPSTATGTVTFFDGATQLGSPVTLSSGSAAYTTAALSIGSHGISAVYSGDTNDAGTTSSTLNQVVNKASTSSAVISSLNPSTFNGSVTFTASVSPANATGTFTFFDGATQLGSPVAISSGSAQYTVSTLSVATHSITAVYSGDTNYLTSTSSALSQVVNKATTTTGVISSLNPSTFNGSVSFTATISPSAATGTVTFFDGATQLGSPVTLSSGSAVYTSSTLSVGSHSITAVYSGDSSYLTSTSSAVSQVVNKASSSSGLISSLNPSTFNASVTLTATVSPATATGTFTFFDGTTQLGSPVTISSGSAAYTSSTLLAGTHSITAVYSGDASYLTSTASAISQIVNKASTTSGVISSLNPSTFNGSVTFTASVSPSNATGTFTFFDGATQLGSPVTISSGSAAYAVSTLSVGTHSITAVYSGDTNYLTSTSSAVSQVVNQASTTTGLTSSLNPSTFNASVTFTATVSPSSATGTMTFFDGTTQLGSPVTISSGSATYTSTTLSVATHSITAVYSGDTDYLTSTSSVVSQVVNKASTTSGVTSSLNPSTFNGSVTFTATVSPSGATGTFTFFDGTTQLGSAVALVSGSATYTTSTLSVATHSITAVYSGDGNYLASTSSAVSQVVNKASTTSGVISSVNPSTFNGSVTFTATASPSSATGTFTFFDGTTQLGSAVALVSGSAAYTSSSLSVGSHSITAVYSGDGSFLTSTSSAVSQVVNQASTTTGVTSSLNPSTFNASVTFTATVSPSNATGTVTFFDGTTQLGTAVTLTSGSAAYTTTTLSVATHSITAVYNGDTNYLTSTSPAVSQVVNQGSSGVTLTSAPNPSTFGASVLFTATLSPSTATGTVDFLDGTTSLGSGTIASGVATLSTTVLTPGTHSITASYSGDANFNATTSPALTQVVNTAPTVTSLISSQNPSIAGQPITLTASVSPAAATGNVVFRDGNTVLSTVQLSSSTAGLVTGPLTPGNHAFTATYSGDSNYGSSVSSGLGTALNFFNATPGSIADANGTGTGFTVRLSGTGANNPASDSNLNLNTTLGSLALSSTTSDLNGQNNLGVAEFIGLPLSSLGITGSSDFSVQATFANVQYSQSYDQFGLFVGDASNSVFRGGLLAVPSGEGYTVQTTGTPGSDTNIQQAPALGPAAGDTVIFTLARASGTWSYTVQNLTTPSKSGAIAVTQPTYLNASSSLVGGVYAANPGNGTSKTETITSFSIATPFQVVQLTPTTTTLTSSANPSLLGQPVTFTASVSPSAASGTVTFYDGTTSLGTGTLANGTATLTVSTLSIGSHSITAGYGGDATYATSTSSVVSQSVGQNPTTTTLTSSSNPVQSGQALVLTARVAPSTATGTVAFIDGSTTLGTATLSSGLASLSVNLTSGNHTLTARYSGDVADQASTSAPLAESVFTPAPTISTSSLPQGQSGVSYGPVSLVASGGSGQYQWSGSGFPSGMTVSSAGAITGTPTGGFNGTVTVTVSDSVSFLTASHSYSLVILAPLSISGNTNLGTFVTGKPVSGSFTANGGTSPYTWVVTGGFSVDSNGHVSGTSGSPGNYSITLSVTDGTGASSSVGLTYSVFGITSTSLPAATTTGPYSASVVAAGGDGSYSFTISGLPAGLTASGASITGRATETGTFPITVQASDAGLTVTATLSLVVTGASPLTISTSSLLDGTVGQPYSQTLTATGGTPSYTWAQSGGVLPDGLTLGSSGTVSGVPKTPGAYSLGVQVTDSAGGKVVGSVALNIKPAPLTITNGSTFPSGMVNVEYPGQILNATGGVAPYTFGSKGSLPSGLSLVNGQITGTPSTSGNFGFTVTVADSSTPPLQGSLAVSLGVRPNSADLLLSAASASFSMTSGATAPPDPNSVSVTSSDPTQTLNYSITAPSAPWLAVTGGSTTPSSLSIALTNAALSLNSAGSPYSATITVTCTSEACNGSAQAITVTLTVTDAPPQLSVDSTLLSFNSSSANPSSSSNSFTVQNTGGGVLAINSITAADSWLTVGTFPATLHSGPGASVTISANPVGLPAGFVTSSVLVTTSAGTATIPVSLLISANSSMSLGPAGEQFSMPQGGALGNASGSFLVNINNATPVNFTASVLAGASWLTGGGSGSANASSPATVSYSIDRTAIKTFIPGAYYATIRVSGPGIVNSPQDYQIVLNISPANTPVVPDPQPAGLIFLSSTPGPQAPQTIQLFASSTTALPYQASASTNDGNKWLSVSPTTGTTVASTPGVVNVNVNSSGLTAGVYRGTVSFASGTSLRSVNVTLVVEQAVKASAIPAVISETLQPRAAGPGCSGGQLVATQTGLVSNFSAPAAWPTPIAVTLVDTCGSIIGDGQIVATFSNGDPPLQLSPVNPGKGTYSGTWTPRKSSAQTTIVAHASATGYSATTVQIVGKVTPNTAPTLAPNGTSDVFHPQVGAGLGPGNIVQIYGTGLASQAKAADTLPLPKDILGTKVLIGGVESPLFYVSAGQVNAQIPFELQANQQYQVIVSANGALTTPQPIQLNAGTPAVLQFTSGQVVAQHQDGSLVSDTAPAQPSEYLTLYMTGLGATDIVVPSGSPSPSDPPANVVDAPEVTLNGTPITPLFVGLTPGLVGLYQINIQVPAGIPDGNYEIVVTQDAVPSNTTLLPVKQGS